MFEPSALCELTGFTSRFASFVPILFYCHNGSFTAILTLVFEAEVLAYRKNGVNIGRVSQ